MLTLTSCYVLEKSAIRVARCTGVWKYGFWISLFLHLFFFFFQAEDGIRDLIVTGVQTCALPISGSGGPSARSREAGARSRTRRGRLGSGATGRGNAGLGVAWVAHGHALFEAEIGRASCRERV